MYREMRKPTGYFPNTTPAPIGRLLSALGAEPISVHPFRKICPATALRALPRDLACAMPDAPCMVTVAANGAPALPNAQQRDYARHRRCTCAAQGPPQENRGVHLPGSPGRVCAFGRAAVPAEDLRACAQAPQGSKQPSATKFHHLVYMPCPPCLLYTSMYVFLDVDLCMSPNLLRCVPLSLACPCALCVKASCASVQAIVACIHVFAAPGACLDACLGACSL